MEWSNDLVLHFLDLYEKESVIWNPSHFLHKNRGDIHEAWKRIQENMYVDFSIPDLKKKKDSLMAAYRTISNKRKENIKNGEDCKPITWFAYEKMDSFLKGRAPPQKIVVPVHVNTEENEKTDKDKIEANNDEIGRVTGDDLTRKIITIKKERNSKEDIKNLTKRMKISQPSTKDNTDTVTHQVPIPIHFLAQEETPSPQITRTVTLEDDQYTLLGSFVASEIRGMKSEYLRRKAKRKILQVLMDINEEEEDSMRNEVCPDPITVVTVPSSQSD